MSDKVIDRRVFVPSVLGGFVLLPVDWNTLPTAKASAALDDRWDAIVIGSSLEHVGNDAIDAKLSNAGSLCVGQLAGNIWLSYDPEFFSLSVYSCDIGHAKRPLSWHPPLS